MGKTARCRVPLKKPRPDAQRFVRVLMGTERADRPPLVEYIVDRAVMMPIIESVGRRWVDPSAGDPASKTAWLDNFIEFWHRMGYDFVRFETGFPFGSHHIATRDTAPGVQAQRYWADEHTGPIMSWEDFERYKWPTLDNVDWAAFEYLDSHLPDGMGLIVCHGGGMYEHLSWIMSYERLCLALYDQPDLVAAVVARLGALMEQFYARLLEMKNIIAIFPGDDMGFKTGTLIGPAALRRYTLPWHKRFAQMTHARGLPYFLHSCGNLQTIMEDLIEDVGIDGKHSFEDAIIPLPAFQEKYGGRIAVLGGVDLNVLSGASAEDVRRHVRQLIDTCAPRGRFAVGSGNSIPSYVPVENYLAMIDEALR